MSRSINQLHGNKLEATDGEIGRVKDFYFDDQSWAVRYVAAETGAWLISRQVLLSPHAFSGFPQFEKTLPVNLSRKQIEASPAIEWHKPVSWQFEEEYHRYYGWPCYWEGDGLRSFPVSGPVKKNLPGTAGAAIAKKQNGADAHLRSARVVRSYRLQGLDGFIGHISDFMMNEKTWVISGLTIKIGQRFSENEVVIPVSKVSRVSYDESTVFVDMTREAVGQGHTPQPALAGAFA
ncbi:MAG TPA: PRC-barrel domain-containing protein [Candidatus Acidoferrales bacterium]|jgi:hypothetical protein|nr:PRC-barrel domain-containing protein [Candidatus Acidoferrales bacterium]